MSREHTDELFERLLTQLGAGGRQQSQGAPGEACPDAELLAAFMERSLEAEERDRCEVHFAACLRCQAQLAALARAELAAGKEKRHRQRTRWPALLDWRWLTPAAAALGVLLVWLAVRSPEPVAPLVAVDQARSPAASVGAKPGPDEPSPPAAELSDAAPSKSPSAEDRGRALPAQRDATGQAGEPSRGVAALKADTPKAQASETLAAPAPAEEVLAKQAQAERADAAPAAALEVKEEQPAAEPAAPQPARAMAAPAASESSIGRTAKDVVASPEGTVQWRFGPGGVIQRSLRLRSGLAREGDESWELQTSGVAEDLLAASAPSASVCWIVGRAGTVLRTTDGASTEPRGATWGKLPFPERVDLVAVVARDAARATVFTSDGRSFTTSDGGKSWQPAATPGPRR